MTERIKFALLAANYEQGMVARSHAMGGTPRLDAQRTRQVATASAELLRSLDATNKVAGPWSRADFAAATSECRNSGNATARRKEGVVQRDLFSHQSKSARTRKPAPVCRLAAVN